MARVVRDYIGRIAFNGEALPQEDKMGLRSQNEESPCSKIVSIALGLLDYKARSHPLHRALCVKQMCVAGGGLTPHCQGINCYMN
jgi:hypothetical protein